MNKNLNNWFDEAEGLPKNTTNNNITKEKKRQGYKCDGRHKTIEELFTCPDCEELFDDSAATITLEVNGHSISRKYVVSSLEGKGEHIISDMLDTLVKGTQEELCDTIY